MASSVRDWLESIGLEQYSETFEDNDLDLDVVADLSESDIKGLGITSLGHRKRLLHAIDALRSQRASTGSRSPADTGTAATPPKPEAAERRQLTVMFCDLADFTALSQQFDPEDLHNVLAAYQDTCKLAIERYDGYVARYMGDSTLAYFGYPAAHEDDAERAVRAGLALVEAVARLDMPEHVQKGLALSVRVGIATGPVVVGDLIGEGGSQESAVFGETPNRAARLREIADTGQVVIESATRRLVGTTFDFAGLGDHVLKGFSQPIAIWEVKREGAVESRFEAIRGGRLGRLIGRDRELDLLRTRWAEAENGHGQSILLSGEAGIGKSRMLAALRDEIRGNRYLHLGYQCSPHHTNSAFYPVIRQLERAASFSPTDSGETKLDKLESLLDRTSEDLETDALLFSALLSLPGDRRYGPIELTPQQLRDRTVAALIDHVYALCRQQPVLFTVEDAHWIDPSTETLLGEIVLRAPAAALFILMTHRPEYRPPWTESLHQHHMTLHRLSRDHGVDMVRIVGGHDLPPALVDGIVTRADGVPLYLEELARSVAGVKPEATDSGLGYRIPATLQASLNATLDRLGDAKAVAQMGAVIGRDFSYRLIEAVAKPAGGNLDDALDQLVASALITGKGSRPETVYSFKHALIQDAAYDSLLTRRRRELHRRIARVLIERFPDVSALEPELLAHHYTAAEDPERAITFWTKAGRMAVDRFAYQEATVHLTKGLELLSSLPETPERLSQELDLQILLGRLLMATKGFASVEAERAYLRAREICEKTNEVRRLRPVLIGLRYVNQVRGNIKAGREIGLQCLELAKRSDDQILFMQANFLLGHTACYFGDFPAARDYLEQSVAAYEPAKHEEHRQLAGLDPCAAALATLGWTLWILGNPDAALKASNRSLDLALRLEHPQSIEHALTSAAYTHLLRREPDDVLKYSEAALDVSREHGFQMRIAMAELTRGWAYAAKGDHARGIDALRAALSDYRNTGSGAGEVFYLTLLAEASRLAGRIEEGLAAIQDSYEVSTDGHWWDAERDRQFGQLLERSADPNLGHAEAYYERALATARRQSARSWELRAATSLARLWQRQDRVENARTLLQPVFVGFAEGFETPDLIEAKALLDELR
ncbi:MAG: AAA family ATPase [Alphaproteobacteria bacterium]|nr:AAA family ATPase [Alphaproteobacteria bacterium]